ncbi:MAG: DUF1570 domain-containing protein [Planctomycetota bacterium]
MALRVSILTSAAFSCSRPAAAVCRWLLSLMLCLPFPAACAADEPAKLERWTVTTESGMEDVTGRRAGQGRDGTLLIEDQAGRLRMFPAKAIQTHVLLDEPWVPWTDEELARQLLAGLGSEFTVTQTEHYLILANSSDEYAEFCGKMLEKVSVEFQKFMAGLGVDVQFPERRLPVLIFAAAGEFEAYAGRLHPEISFTDTPGFYTVRDNLVLLQDLSQDRSLRTAAAIRRSLADQPLQVATVIHEAVHQLAFNTGVQVRMADNPVWFSEGLSLCFEQPSLRTPLLWTRPNLLNARHHAEFLRISEAAELPISLADLIRRDALFQQSGTAVAAYAESWALVTWLVREQPEQLGRWIGNLRQQQPLDPVTADERTAMFVSAFGGLPSELASQMTKDVRRLRASK